MSASEPTWANLLERLDHDLAEAERPDWRPRDDEAWREFDRRVRRYTRAFFRMHPGHSAELDDVIQAVLIKAQSPRFVAKMQRVRSPAGYLVVVIRNMARDLSRRQSAEQRAVGRLGMEVVLSPAAGRPELESDDKLDALRRELRALSPEEHQLLRMRFWENLSIGEIAEALGIKYSAAAQRLFRLLKRLKAHMEQADV